MNVWLLTYAWPVPAWVLKTLMALIVLAGLGFAAWAWKVFSKPPLEQWQLAMGYKELDALRGKSATSEEISEVIDEANLDEDGTRLLFEGFKKQYESTPTATLEKIVSQLKAKLDSFSDDEDNDE